MLYVCTTSVCTCEICRGSVPTHCHQTKEEVSQGQFEFSYGTVDTVAGPTLESTSNALATTLSGPVDICAFFSSCGIPLSRVCYATIHLVSKRIEKTLNYD